jgi:nucleotide-binding universal stress UspA family protein
MCISNRENSLNYEKEKEMKSIEKIVVPVDFTKSTHELVEYAVYMAARLSAVINFVHVVADYPGDAMIGSPFAQEYQDKDFAASKQKMTHLVEDSQEMCPGCDGDVVYGDPVEQIVKFAETKKADLLILGTHGAKGLEKVLLGNVAEHVLRKAHRPVLIMNPFENISS